MSRPENPQSVSILTSVISTWYSRGAACASAGASTAMMKMALVMTPPSPRPRERPRQWLPRRALGVADREVRRVVLIEARHLDVVVDVPVAARVVADEEVVLLARDRTCASGVLGEQKLPAVDA